MTDVIDSSIYLRVEVRPDTTLEDAAWEINELVDRVLIDVVCEFNGVDLIARHRITSSHSTIQAWNAKYKRLAEMTKSKE